MTTTLDDLPLPVPTWPSGFFGQLGGDAFSADQIRAARREGYELALLKAQEGREPVAWRIHPHDYGIGSAGVYAITQVPQQKDAWLKKGWAPEPLYTSPPPKSDEPCGLFEVRVAGPDDVHSHDSEIEALRQANDINLQYVADCLKHPDSADHVMCVATVHKTDESKSAEPVASLTGPERVWTCTVIGKAEDLPRGSDAPMRKAVFDAFAQQTGDAPAHIFSCWGNPVPERYRAVMENRLPDPEVIRKECLEVLNILPKSDELPTCTEERPCVNCFAGTTPCLGPHKRPPKSDEERDAERWRMAIHTDNLTGCQYFSRFGALTPRLASDGVHIVGCKN